MGITGEQRWAERFEKKKQEEPSDLHTLQEGVFS